MLGVQAHNSYAFYFEQGLTILLCSSVYPGTCYMDQVGTYRDLPAFDSQVLGLKVCIAMTSHTQIFM